MTAKTAGNDIRVHQRFGNQRDSIADLGVKPATLVKLAIEEDAEVIGISSLATDHLLVPRLMAALRDAGAHDVQVIVGGIVPAHDEKLLLGAGVARVFHPGAALDDISAEVRSLSARARALRNNELQ